MKTIFKILTPIIALSILVSGVPFENTSAMYIDDTGWPWWSVEELLEYEEEIRQEEQELCGDDFGCREELFFSKMENENDKDNKYQSLQMLMEYRFVVTSVNPTTGAIKVIYNDEDEWMRRMGIDEKEDLNMLYLGWFEENPEQIYSLPRPIEEYMLDEVEDAHLVYKWQRGNGEEYLLIPGEEVELPMTGNELTSNMLGKIGYVAEANYFNAVGQFDYGSCLNEPDYGPGVDCKLMLSAGNSVGYFPPRETIVIDETIDANIDQPQEPTDDPADEPVEPVVGPTDEPITDLIDEDESKPVEEIVDSIGDELISKQENELLNNTVEISAPETGQRTVEGNTVEILAPETGQRTAEGKRAVEMPWWMIVIFISGGFIVLWFLWSRKKNKNQKKSAKTLDK